ncbi:MAG: GNAT family N-acetyltransferase [Treponema sp.]|nr:GNAT family N-acetyltransferase [Treponema sp.]
MGQSIGPEAGGGLRPAVPEDAPGIAEIYNYYIKNTVITFEEELVDSRTMAGRIEEVIPRYPWFVWEAGGELVAYAYAHAWNERTAYRFAAEDSVYLKPGWERRGIGRRLLERLIEELRQRQIHVLMSVITVPNPASVGLHERLAFKKTGQFDAIGFKHGRWLDVGYWELILDARGGGPAEGGAGREDEK